MPNNTKRKLLVAISIFYFEVTLHHHPHLPHRQPMIIFGCVCAFLFMPTASTRTLITHMCLYVRACVCGRVACGRWLLCGCVSVARPLSQHHTHIHTDPFSRSLLAYTYNIHLLSPYSTNPLTHMHTHAHKHKHTELLKMESLKSAASFAANNLTKPVSVCVHRWMDVCV